MHNAKWLLMILFPPLLCLPVAAQDPSVAIAMPVTLSADSFATHRLQTFDPSAKNMAVAFRSVFYPTLKLGTRWFFYSAVEVRSTPYFYYESYGSQRGVDARLLQGTLGYIRNSGRWALSLKAGKLPSAFGAFPLRYDDTLNPLLDPPLAYSSYIGLRPDQLPCGTADLLNQIRFDEIDFSCGGSEEERYGLPPVTLRGLPAAEIDLSYRRLDWRFQLSTSSPANPQSLLSDSQHLQWSAGGGITIQQGFRVAFSAFRGPFLEKSVSAFLPAGKGVRDYPATASGVEVQWARGRWSASGEWQWFQFDFPAFRTAPAVSAGYAEVKAVLSPRFYVAFRASQENFNHVEDSTSRSASPFQPNDQAFEWAVGYHVNHFQTVKLGYEWIRSKAVAGSHDNVLGVQVVTSINSITKAIR